MTKPPCAFCGKPVEKSAGHINRARKAGMNLYCNRVCSGAAHRSDFRTEEQRKADKAAYDRVYREANREKKRRQSHEWYKRNRDPEKEREIRKAKMPRHVEYCRQPEYKKYKHQYDIQRVSSEYGEYAEAHRLLVELEREIIRLVPDKYERLKARGYYDKENVQRRKRNAGNSRH